MSGKCEEEQLELSAIGVGSAVAVERAPLEAGRDDLEPGPVEYSGRRDKLRHHVRAIAYRLSVQAGNPLSERQLDQMFGRTSRRWARARIADARQAPPLQDPPGIPVTASSQAPITVRAPRSCG